ncbi:DUF1761 domain-containing protein [Sporosarcina saromensis]|uniref:DUF1761 domain-containing protein n=1 Tax=Sporosarcina saromensis TaxID=359365 RepID=A0ABU4GBF0_9BACL|nr:DUF1761 domain-containing protein [Sporosarcina saromensis]MDW0114300.1 DUF1761 domain-containing protein [Sporosarcina saromensis]
MTLDGSTVSVLAIVAGAVLYMVYGGIYYSKVVGKESQSKGATKYIVSVIVAFISSSMVALLVGAIPSSGVLEGALVGAIIGLLISLVYLKNTLFGLVQWKTFYIAVGDHFIIFTLVGILHGLL